MTPNSRLREASVSTFIPSARSRIPASGRPVYTDSTWHGAQTFLAAAQRLADRHPIWGQRYLLKVEEREAPPAVTRTHHKLTLGIRPNTDTAKRAEIFNDWYRSQIKAAVPDLIAHWETILKITVAGFHVQRMKTKWGSCNHSARTIRLNTELAKKPKACLEYIVVHEMAHIIEPTHNDRFIAIMNRHMPDWRHHRQALNRLPVRHEDWKY